MEISIDTKKQKALKKLLNKTDKELKETIEKVISDWISNIIETKYRTSKTQDEIIDEILK